MDRLTNKRISNLIISAIVVIIVIMIILFYFINENFSINTILSNNINDDADYQECLNQENQIKYLSDGQFQNCSTALTQLSSSGIDIQSDIGFGKISELCPVSALISSPSSCLKNRLNKQKKTINETKEIIASSPINLKLNSIKNKLELEAYKKQMDKLFLNKEILEPIKYIKQNRLKTSNDPFEPIINDIVNPSPSSSNTPSATELASSTFSSPSQSFNDNNMLLQTNPDLKLQILGY
jgi:hypothetical protein